LQVNQFVPFLFALANTYFAKISGTHQIRPQTPIVLPPPSSPTKRISPGSAAALSGIDDRQKRARRSLR
jgi:hypothetical protein